jgi:RimJ/RimL family protein N-acetyltransferase
LRPGQSEQVIGGFDLWRVGPGVVELGYWVHVDFTGRGYATACARALTQAGLALSGVARVEIHTDEANAISAAIPRRLGYRLDRVDELPPEAPAHSGRLQLWVNGMPWARRAGLAAPASRCGLTYCLGRRLWRGPYLRGARSAVLLGGL